MYIYPHIIPGAQAPIHSVSACCLHLLGDFTESSSSFHQDAGSTGQLAVQWGPLGASGHWAPLTSVMYHLSLS